MYTVYPLNSIIEGRNKKVYAGTACAPGPAFGGFFYARFLRVINLRNGDENAFIE